MRKKFITIMILIVSILFLCPNDLVGGRINKLVTFTSGSYDKGYRYNIQGWVYIHIEGEPYDRGYQYGYLAAAEIVDMINIWTEIGCGIKILKIFTVKTPEQWWKICKSKSTSTFLKQVPEEYQEEMKGIADGVRARGGKVFGNDIKYEDIVAANFVQDSLFTILFSKYRFHLFHGILSFSKVKIVLSMFFSSVRSSGLNLINAQHLGHCSAFIATGDATKDRGIVVAHSSFFNSLITERCNIILDVQPSKGYRFIMTCPPGSIWSQEDFYQNDRGIVLTETELPQGPWKNGGTPKGVRGRRAIQYSDSIDDVIDSLKNGNNGLIPNEWLIGDTKTGEIASLEQALYNAPIKRTFNGFYSSYTAPNDDRVKRELFGVVYLLQNTSKAFYDFRAAGRDKKFAELEKQYYGKIDEEIAKKILAIYPICRDMTDGKITSSKLMENMGLLTFMGNPNGSTCKPTDELKKIFHGITELPASGWVEIYPFQSKPTIMQSTNTLNYNVGNSRVIWQYETGDMGNMNYTSSVVSEDFVYTATSSGKIYVLNTVNGKQAWSKNIGEKSVEPAVSKDLLFVGTDKGLYAIFKETGRIKWEKSIGDISSKPSIANNLVIVGCSTGEIYAFDIDSGKTIWTFKLPDSAAISKVQDDTIYISSGDTCYCYNIANSELLWEYETDGKITQPPVINDHTIYFGSWDGNLYALDSVTGNLRWKHETGWGIVTKPTISNEMVFVGSLDNHFYALNENNGELEWLFPCKAAIHSSPVVYGEYVFFGCDDGRFYALNKKDGELAWSFTPGYFIDDNNVNNYITTPIISSPTVENGVVYISTKGNVYALDAQTWEESKKTLEEKSTFQYDILLIVILCLGIMLIFISLIIHVYYRRKDAGQKR